MPLDILVILLLCIIVALWATYNKAREELIIATVVFWLALVYGFILVVYYPDTEIERNNEFMKVWLEEN